MAQACPLPLPYINYNCIIATNMAPPHRSCLFIRLYWYLKQTSLRCYNNAILICWLYDLTDYQTLPESNSTLVRSLCFMTGEETRILKLWNLRIGVYITVVSYIFPTKECNCWMVQNECDPTKDSMYLDQYMYVQIQTPVD